MSLCFILFHSESHQSFSKPLGLNQSKRVLFVFSVMGIFLSRICTFLHDWVSMQDEVEVKSAVVNPTCSGDGRIMQRSISLVTRRVEVVEVEESDDCCSSKETKKLQVSVSFKSNRAEAETENLNMISITPHFDVSANTEMQSVPVAESSSSKMKIRRSFGSSRRVVVMGSQWWKLLDSTELQMSSTTSGSSSETAKAKWSRAKAKAVRVGKGLSKNAVFRKLASQHWLEAVDPGHRYGHNLRYYHVRWLKSPSRETFFHWLNHGEGKELNLDEICPRLKLHQQRVNYLSPAEREAYEVLLEDGKFKYKKSNQLIDTSGDAKWIFVLSTSGTLYVGKKKKGLFHHSSFLAGGAISAAGRVFVENGVLKGITRQSGHYRPTEENFEYFVSFLKENNVDLTGVDMTCIDEEAGAHPMRDRPRNWSHEDLSNLADENQVVKVLKRPLLKTLRIRSLPRRISFVLIPEKHHPFRSLSAPVYRWAASAHG